jgi:peptidoglycan/LPS O-acetylase OafA/YrhL
MQKDFRTNNFDLIRIVTAVLVLINHSLAHLELHTPAFYTVIKQFPRVPMFFVMSGYLLSASFEKNSNLKSYFTNRLFRIYPGLWVCLILTVILFATIGGVSFFNAEAIPWFISQAAGLIWTPHFLKDFGYGSYNGSLWTIVVELQFYLALPIIYFIGTLISSKWIKDKKKANLYFYTLFVFSFILAFTLRHYFTETDDIRTATEKGIRYSILPHAYIFMTGILMQRWKIFKSPAIYGKGLYWAIGYLAFVYLVPDTTIKNMIQMLILAPCTIAIAYSIPGLATKWLNNRDLSYGVYMYHGLLLTILVEFNMKGSYWYLLGVFVVTMILSWLSYTYVETPAMKFAKKRNKARADAKNKTPDKPGPAQPEVLVGEKTVPA